MTGLSYADGRTAELEALRSVVTRGPAVLPVIAPGARLLLLGIGASFAALATPMLQLREAGHVTWRSDASDLPERLEGVADLAIAVSQSGRSRETVGVLRRLQEAEVAVWALTNTSENPMQSISRAGLTLGDLPDSRVSTVGFVATFAVLGMLADRQQGAGGDAGWVGLPDVIASTAGAAHGALAAFAERWLVDGAIDVVASAAQLTTAEAVALLLREGPLVPASAFSTRPYLHGPMDCAGRGASQIVIGDARELQLATQLAQKRTGVLVLTPSRDPLPEEVVRVAIPEGLSPSQRAIVEVCVLQDLVAEVARVRGNPVDEIAFVRQDTKIDGVDEL